MSDQDSHITYINKRGDPVNARITYHAAGRFKQRWNRMFPGDQLEDCDVIPQLKQCFQTATRIIPTRTHHRNYRVRAKKHKCGSVYFRAPNNMVFIIADSTLITVEFSGKSCRMLNYRGYTYNQNSTEVNKVNG